MNSSGELTNTFSKSSLPNCPFAFDDEDEYTVTSVQSKNTLASSVGSVRVGGSKEARLRRTAIVGDSEDLLIESLYGVRVDNVPERIPREVLLEDFEKFGKVGDFKMLLTRAGRNRGQAFVRFYSAEDAHSACEHMTGKIYKAYHAFDDKKGLVCELAQHQSFFSNNTGALGIANVPTGEIAVRENVQIKQDVELADCCSRSGYPWGSKHELKRLEPHSAEANAFELQTLQIDNVNSKTTEHTVRSMFEKFGCVRDVYMPKPLIIVEYSQHKNETNLGRIFVRMKFKRDAKRAAAELNGTELDGNIIKVTLTTPYVWPTAKTRRYY